jgi:[acyl-carrier-protein] S-malonyltransferase
MRDAADRLAGRFESVSWSMPKIPVIQNVEAKSYESVEAIRAALAQQLYLPVQWTASVHELAARGVTRAAECGPGKVLVGLLKRIERAIDGRAIGAPAELAQAIRDWHRLATHVTSFTPRN